MGNTTKICIYNITTNEVTLAGNKQAVARYLGVKYNTVRHWLRYDPIGKVMLRGHNYLILPVTNVVKKLPNS